MLAWRSGKAMPYLSVCICAPVHDRSVSCSMDFLFMLLIGAVVIFYKITTPRERNRWWWNCVAILLIGGMIGLSVTILKTGSIPNPCCDSAR